MSLAKGRTLTTKVLAIAVELTSTITALAPVAGSTILLLLVNATVFPVMDKADENTRESVFDIPAATPPTGTLTLKIEFNLSVKVKTSPFAKAVRALSLPELIYRTNTVFKSGACERNPEFEAKI